MTTATFEIIFPHTDVPAVDLEAAVVLEVHERVIVHSTRSSRHDGHVSVFVRATFGNLAEVKDHQMRFVNMTGVPARNVHIRKVVEG